MIMLQHGETDTRNKSNYKTYALQCRCATEDFVVSLPSLSFLQTDPNPLLPTQARGQLRRQECGGAGGGEGAEGGEGQAVVDMT